MQVLVTGSSGHVGNAVVLDLVEHGYDVVGVDQRPSPLGEFYKTARFVIADLSDVGHVAGVMRGCDAVIHMAAIPRPYRHPDEVVFVNNVSATFATLQAASLLGIKNAVIASSISALGTAWAPEPFPHLYAPVDEAHPMLVHDCYGLSKEIDERTGEMFHRKDGMQVIALRFHWVASMQEIREKAAAMAADPLHQGWWRQFYGYVDLRDAAMACRKAVEVDGLGFEPFLITAADSLSALPTEQAIRQTAPGVEIKRPLIGRESGYSIDKARRLLGYAPRWSWFEK